MSYIDSYQFDLDQELQAERAAGYHTCPKCGGVPDLDDDGRPYTCYCCFDTGCITAARAELMEREETDYREQFMPTRLGTYTRQMHNEDDYPDPAEMAPGHGLFTRLLPRPRVHFVSVIPSNLCDDDIPF